MTSPDPTDLRLASALAEIGRATVLQIAAHAGVSPEEAAVRLLRMGQAGLPLVVGVEGDRAALYGWIRAQQAPVPPPAARPLEWGVPQSAAGTHLPQQPGPPAAVTSATVGETLPSRSPAGEQVWITLVEVVDTADALIAAAGHPLSAGMRAAVVHTEVTAGRAGYQAIPDTWLTLVLADGTEVYKSGIVLSSRPPFRSGIAAGEPVGGHTVFELDAQSNIVGVRWRATQDAVPLDWRTA